MYSKPGCHLCDIAREIILSAKSEIDFQFIEMDIEKDSELFSQYKEDIPVIYINGSFFSKYTVDKQVLTDKLSD